MLDEGPHDRRGALGAERVGAIAAVGEDVHLLGRDLTLLTDAPVEDPDVFEHRRDDELEAVAVGELREGRDDALPLGRARAEDVVGPDGAWNGVTASLMRSCSVPGS